MTEIWVNPPTGGRAPEQSAKATIYALPPARRKALEKARRTWPEAQPEDFERVGRDFIDRATGTADRRVGGDPLLGGAQREDVETFYVADGLIVFLRKAGNPGLVVSNDVGEFSGRAATAAEHAQLHHSLARRP